MFVLHVCFEADSLYAGVRTVRTFIGFLPSVAHFVASQGIMVRRGIAAYVTPKITTTNLELLKSFTSFLSKAKKYQHLQPIYFYIKNKSKDFFKMQSSLSK